MVDNMESTTQVKMMVQFPSENQENPSARERMQNIPGPGTYRGMIARVQAMGITFDSRTRRKFAASGWAVEEAMEW